MSKQKIVWELVGIIKDINGKLTKGGEWTIHELVVQYMDVNKQGGLETRAAVFNQLSAKRAYYWADVFGNLYETFKGAKSVEVKVRCYPDDRLYNDKWFSSNKLMSVDILKVEPKEGKVEEPEAIDGFLYEKKEIDYTADVQDDLPF